MSIMPNIKLTGNFVLQQETISLKQLNQLKVTPE